MSSLIFNPRWRFLPSNLTRPMVLEIEGDTKGYELEDELNIDSSKEDRVVEWGYKQQKIAITGNACSKISYAFPSPDKTKMIIIFRDNIGSWGDENVKYLVVYNADGQEHCRPMLPMTKTPEDKWPYLSPRRAIGCGPILWSEKSGAMRVNITIDFGKKNAVENRDFDPYTGEYGEVTMTYMW